MEGGWEEMQFETEKPVDEVVAVMPRDASYGGWEQRLEDL